MNVTKDSRIIHIMSGVSVIVTTGLQGNGVDAKVTGGKLLTYKPCNTMRWTNA